MSEFQEFSVADSPCRRNRTIAFEERKYLGTQESINRYARTEDKWGVFTAMTLKELNSRLHLLHKSTLFVCFCLVESVIY